MFSTPNRVQCHTTRLEQCSGFLQYLPRSATSSSMLKCTISCYFVHSRRTRLAAVHTCAHWLVAHMHALSPCPPAHTVTSSLAASMPDDNELSELIESIQGFRNFREV